MNHNHRISVYLCSGNTFIPDTDIASPALNVCNRGALDDFPITAVERTTESKLHYKSCLDYEVTNYYSVFWR